MHFMLSSFLIALTINFIPITNSSPDKGQPCLTPCSKGKNLNAKQFCFDPVLNVGSEVKNSQVYEFFFL